MDYLSKRKVFIPRIVYLDISSIVQALLHRNVEQQVASIPVVLFTPSEAVAVDTPLARIPVGVQMVNGQAPLNSRGDRTVLHTREAHICVAQRVSHRAITVARAQPSSIISLAVRHMTAHHCVHRARLEAREITGELNWLTTRGGGARSGGEQKDRGPHSLTDFHLSQKTTR